MSTNAVSRISLIAVCVAFAAAMIGKTVVQLYLRDSGVSSTVSSDLSYLVVPPILASLLWPIWLCEKPFLRRQFRISDLSWRIALQAIAIGVLLRLLSWSKLVAGVSFGRSYSDDTSAIIGPAFSFQCHSFDIVLLGFLVMALIVPLVEEIVHRGYIQTALQKRGFVISVFASAAIFTVFHRFSSWQIVFISGLTLGTLYWLTHSLWAPLISHATVNALIQVDWRCLAISWNPTPESLPLLGLGTLSILVFVASAVAIILLLRRIATGANSPPRQRYITKR